MIYYNNLPEIDETSIYTQTILIGKIIISLKTVLQYNCYVLLYFLYNYLLYE